MSATKRDRYLAGPENETFNKLKGQIVNFDMLSGPSPFAQVKLVWIDVYTIGVLVDPKQKVPAIIYKGPGLIISLADLSVEEWEKLRC